MKRTHTKYTYKTLIAFAVMVLSAFSIASFAHAACSTPSGVGGDMLYNADYNVMQYCDDTKWVPMGQRGSPTFGGVIDNPVAVAITNTSEIGNLNDVEIKGNYLMGSSDVNDEFQVYDISTPTSPTLVHSEFFGTNEFNNDLVSLNGNFLYVTEQSDQTLHIYDVTDPTTPVKRGTLIDADLGNFNYIESSGNFLYYLSRNQDRLTIVDVSDPDTPVKRGSLVDSTNLNQPSGLAITGNYALTTIINGTWQFTVLDISDPDNPAIHSSTTNANLVNVNDIKVSGSNAYITVGQYDQFISYDISNLAAPSELDVITDATILDSAYGMEISGNYAYVASYGGYTSAIDISNPSSLSIAGSVTDPSLTAGSRINLFGSQAIISASGANVYGVVDISTPSTPVVDHAEIGIYFSGQHRTMAKKDTYLLTVTQDARKLAIFDLSIANKPILVATENTAINGIPQGISIDGDFLYLSTSTNRLYTYDISDIDAPTLRSTHINASFNDPESIDAQGDFVYVASQNNDNMIIVDVSDPDNPVNRGTFTSANVDRPRGILVSGNYAYLAADSSNTVVTVDITDPDAPTEVHSLSASVSFSNPYRMILDSNTIFFGAGSRVFSIDISNPAVPIEADAFSSPSAARDVALISPGYIIAANLSGSPAYMRTIDATDPYNLATLGTINLAGTVGGGNYDSQVINDIVYYLGGDALYMVDVGTSSNTCENPTGLQGDLTYNRTDHVMQFCNGPRWASMGPIGNGGGGCFNPRGDEGDMVYNSKHRIMQYCEGDEWVGIGKDVVNPAEIADMALWLDAADSSTITESGGLVSQWDDKSGNDRHAVQADTDDQPTTGTRTINGLNTLDFIGPGGQYWLNDDMQFPEIPAGNAYTVFIVHSVDLLDKRRYILGKTNLYHDALTIGIEQTSGEAVLRRGDDSDLAIATGEGVAAGTPSIMTVTSETAGNSIWINGGSAAMTNNTDPNYTHTINSISTTSAAPYDNQYDGQIAEIMIYERVLNAEEMDAVGEYLSQKWDITWDSVYNPADVSDLAIWLDASDTSSIVESGGAVSQWSDKSGNGNHATQGTGTRQPITGTRTINGKNVLDFDGTDDSLSLPASTYDIPGDDNTVVAVVALDTYVGDRLIYGSNSGGRHFYLRTRGGANPDSVGYNSGPGQSQTTYKTFTPDGEANIFMGFGDGNSNMAIDGDNEATGSGVTAPISQYENYVSGNSQEIDGRYAELLVYRRALSQTERDDLKVHLATKWGIDLYAVTDPTDVAAPLAWYDAADAGTITESGGDVSQWDDKSGNAHHATQATPAEQPTTGTRDINGVNAMDFNPGNNEFFSLPSSLYTQPLVQDANVIFVVAKFDNTSNAYDMILGGENGGGGNIFFLGAEGGGSDVSFNSSGQVDDGIRDSSPHIFVMRRYDDDTLAAYYDGALVGNQVVGNQTLANMQIGAVNTNPDWDMDGLVGEMLIFDGEMTDIEMNQIGNYLATKWGLTWDNL